MNVFDPSTWHTLDDHPVMLGLGDPNWRENYREVGDAPDAALHVVRKAALQIKSTFPSATTELVVLDSLDWFAMVNASEFDGQMGHCEDETVYVRFDTENRESFYEDDIPVEKLSETIQEFFGIDRCSN
ncbi:hypothetical protein DTL21_04535 [Bremerella cremea]|uniref:Uncharacterized protein n=1 Tax=Blastopirellula marina TaxID=124 RepID=A0A2S8FYQ5_9BACT|nr:MULTISPECIES: hypothetical protein [Pirellulaceae]PQO37220.1 hypothetical protein C5Y83_04535 [Blastopirellula marina]RCS49607.1 hypothetical protein DTL21_04535 [Bremerella cremea]